MVIESLALAAVGVLADLKTIQGSFVNIQTATSTLNGAILVSSTVMLSKFMADSAVFSEC